MPKSQYNPEIHNRRSIRLKGHDYAGGGLYFVTMCTKNRRQLLGIMQNGTVELSAAGREAEKCWKAIPDHFPGVVPRELAIMPDHVHGIIQMPVRAKHFSPIRTPLHVPKPGNRPHGTSKTLGSVVRGFKVGVTKWVRKNTDVQDVWHRNYYEMVVRSPEAEQKITEYIRMNPWRCVQNLGGGPAKGGVNLRGMGNPALWHAEKLGILCSRNAPRPASIPQAAVYFGGFHSPMEKEIFAKLLEHSRNIIWCPAWGLERAASAPGVCDALEQNRMLILEMKNREGDLASADARNRFILENADQLWLPHINPGGMIDRLVEEMAMQGKMINRERAQRAQRM